MLGRVRHALPRAGWPRKATVSVAAGRWQPPRAVAQTRLLALAALQPGDRVLDVACGTGMIAFQATALVGPTGAVVGTDRAEPLVEPARQRAPARPGGVRPHGR